ncbi:MAG TPA: toxin-antitoxin system YwqK family antitoxin [Epsilonproteobacteria bacterium]|nr:toxin-antitoxin system YwqK family antitoxin [Campylobacterota bacterium]
MRYILSTIFMVLIFAGCSSTQSPNASTSKSDNVIREYYTGGGLLSELIITDKETQSGILKRYGYDQKLTSTVEVRHGKKNGIETMYDPDGRVILKTPFANGIQQGVQTAYYANGSPMFTVTYVNGIKHGPAKSYLADGNIKETIMFENDRPR